MNVIQIDSYSSLKQEKRNNEGETKTKGESVVWTRVFVTIPSGKSISLLVRPDHTIATLKLIIASKLNIKDKDKVEHKDKGQADSGGVSCAQTSFSSFSFSLSYNGKLLCREGATLQDYNIQPMATLDLGLGLRGGGLDEVSEEVN